MEHVADFLKRYPELAIFLVLTMGFWSGRLKYRGIVLGPVMGALLSGLCIGALFAVPVSATAQSFMFLLFLFGIGYSAGPRFFPTLRGHGLRWLSLATLVAGVGLLASYGVARYLDLDAGLAAGLLSGALTESPAVAAASETLRSLPVSVAEQQRLIGHIAVANAVCYVFGAFGTIFFCSLLAPRLLRIDLRTEARRLEEEMGLWDGRSVASAWQAFAVRACVVPPEGAVVGRTLAEAEAMVHGGRVFILRLRRAGVIIDVTPDLHLQAGDVLAISGRTAVLVELLGARGNEVADAELLDLPYAVQQILLSRSAAIGCTLEALAATDVARGVHLRRLQRGGQELPLAAQLILRRGDVLTVSGPEAAVAAVAGHLGSVLPDDGKTDFAFMTLAIFIGASVGALAVVPAWGVRLAVGSGVGALLAGLLLGWLQLGYPHCGRIPAAAVAFMTTLGQTAFIGMIGMVAGPLFFSTLAEIGVALFLGGVVVTLLPLLCGLYFGRHVLGLNPVLLLGGLAGAQTATAAMVAVQERAASPLPVLGYSGTIAFGHVLLTACGSLIVLLMT